MPRNSICSINFPTKWIVTTLNAIFKSINWYFALSFESFFFYDFLFPTFCLFSHLFVHCTNSTNHPQQTKTSALSERCKSTTNDRLIRFRSFRHRFAFIVHSNDLVWREWENLKKEEKQWRRVAVITTSNFLRISETLNSSKIKRWNYLTRLFNVPFHSLCVTDFSFVFIRSTFAFFFLIHFIRN